MLNEVYNRRIIELAGTIPRIGRLHDPDASATAHSKLCGSTVTIDLKMDGDTVTDFAVLEPVRDYKARHASTLLTFDAVVDAIGQIEAKRDAKPAAP
jgi:NifU-like protein involved in Fe-S cluster formation